MTARTILICLHDFSRGGTERIAIGLAASWTDAGRDVTILCGTEQGGLRDMVDPRVKVVALDPPIQRGLLSRLRLGRAMARQLDKLKPDVIFLPGNFHLVLAPALRRAEPRAVIVLKISNPPLPQGLPMRIGRILFRRFARSDRWLCRLDRRFCAGGGGFGARQAACGCCTIPSICVPAQRSGSRPAALSASSGLAGWSRKRISALALQTMAGADAPGTSDHAGGWLACATRRMP